MNKQEFYKKYTVKIRYHDELTTIELKDIDPDELWQWIEEEIKQARVDELDKAMNVPNLTKWQDYYDNRIKELTGELK